MNLIRKKFRIALLENQLLRQQTVEIKSSFNFLNQVNGLKPGSVSVVLGTTSSGKSTFMRSIIINTLNRNRFKKIVCYLSEETVSEYTLELFKATRGVDFQDRLKIYSEQDCKTDQEKSAMMRKAFEEDADIIIFDNITTSALYDGRTPQHQSKFSNRLKSYAKKTSKALLCVAHTDGSVSKRMDRMISSSNIRGSKSLSNIAEFFYIIHQMDSGGYLHSYLQIEKHRGQNPDSKLFMMNYNRDKNIYTSDMETSFDSFKKTFKERDAL